jgi:hypothetical protein
MLISRRVKLTAYAAVTSAVLFGGAIARAVDEPAATGVVKFTWGLMGRLHGDDLTHTLNDGATVQTGDGLKLYIEPQSPCSLYVIHKAPDGSLTRLYPSDTEAGQIGRIYVPSGSEWLRLGPDTGHEVFFLVASAEPLQRLQQLIDGHEKTSDPDAKRKVGGEIEDEIRAIWKQQQSAKPIEVPAVIAGNVRGFALDGTDEMPKGVQVQADKLFVKVLTLVHR